MERPPSLWNFQFPPWWGYGSFLELHNALKTTDNNAVHYLYGFNSFEATWIRRMPQAYELKRGARVHAFHASSLFSGGLS